MLILFDNGTPAPLRHALSGHIVVEAIERGWDRLAVFSKLWLVMERVTLLGTFPQKLPAAKHFALLSPTTSLWFCRDVVFHLSN